tara:strand:- start:173 stop:427 length:255 start_codon:yes stop_codon:yes gene_type:complete
MGKYTKEVEWNGYIYEVDKKAYVTDKGIANTKTKKLVGKAPKSLLQKIGWSGNKGGLVRKFKTCKNCPTPANCTAVGGCQNKGK